MELSEMDLEVLDTVDSSIVCVVSASTDVVFGVVIVLVRVSVVACVQKRVECNCLHPYCIDKSKGELSKLTTVVTVVVVRSTSADSGAVLFVGV